MQCLPIFCFLEDIFLLFQDTSGAAEEKDLKDVHDDEDTNLDFEEISDGELEEERTRGNVFVQTTDMHLLL